jgi:hypothetical protein
MSCHKVVRAKFDVLNFRAFLYEPIEPRRKWLLKTDRNIIFANIEHDNDK